MLKKCSLISRVTLLALLALGAGQAQAANMEVRVYNRSSTTVRYIYVSPTYKSRFGDQDLLGNRVIEPGRSVLVDFDVDDADNECRLDIQAKSIKGSGGAKWEKQMNVCREDSWYLRD